MRSHYNLNSLVFYLLRDLESQPVVLSRRYRDTGWWRTQPRVFRAATRWTPSLVDDEIVYRSRWSMKLELRWYGMPLQLAVRMRWSCKLNRIGVIMVTVFDRSYSVMRMISCWHNLSCLICRSSFEAISHWTSLGLSHGPMRLQTGYQRIPALRMGPLIPVWDPPRPAGAIIIPCQYPDLTMTACFLYAHNSRSS